MSDNCLCKLCQDDLAVNVDLKAESTSSKLLQTLFDCYKIDVSILEKSSSICKKCHDGVSQICESLDKWSKAQKVLKAIPLDIVDSKTFQVNLKPHPETPFSEIQLENLQTDDVIFIKEEEPEEFLEEANPSLSESQKPLRASDIIFIKGEESETDYIDFLDDEGPPLSDIQKEPLRTDEPIFIENGNPETEDEDLVEEISSEDSDDGMPAKLLDWRSSLQNFFCVCLGPDGLALTILLKDKTMENNIRMLCTCCNQLLFTISDIRKHASITRPNPEYWCGVCDVIYSSSFELKIHEKMMSHFRARTSAMIMRCLKCDKISNQFSDAIKHENDIHDKPSHVSYKSSKSFNSLDSFEKHQRKYKNHPQHRYPDMIPNICLKCSLYFDSRDSFEEHQWKHNNHIQCRYPKCKERFTLWEQYTSHLTWHKRLFKSVSRRKITARGSREASENSQ